MPLPLLTSHLFPPAVTLPPLPLYPDLRKNIVFFLYAKTRILNYPVFFVSLYSFPKTAFTGQIFLFFVKTFWERHLNLRFAVTRKSNKNSKYLSYVKRFRETVHPAKNTGSMLAFCIWKNYNIREMDPGKGARAEGPRRRGRGRRKEWPGGRRQCHLDKPSPRDHIN